MRKSTGHNIEYSMRSAYIGASWDKSSQKWRSQFTHNKIKVYLGMYEDDRIAAIMHNLAVFLHKTQIHKIDEIFKVRKDSEHRLFAGEVGPIPKEIISIICDITEHRSEARKLLTPKLIAHLESLIPESIPRTIIKNDLIFAHKCSEGSIKIIFNTSNIKEFNFDKDLDELFSNEENFLIFGRPESPDDSATKASSITHSLTEHSVTDAAKKLKPY